MGVCQYIQSSDDAIYGKGTEKSIIKNAEKKLGLSFSKEYSDYLSVLGIAMIDGHELTGISKSERTSVINVTISERMINPAIPQNYYVIEQTNIDGIIIWQDESGKIYQSAPGKAARKINDSMEDYLKKK